MIRLYFFLKWFFKPEIYFIKSLNNIEFDLKLIPNFYFEADFINDKVILLIRYEKQQ